MNWETRFFELLSLVKRFLKRQATIGELRAGIRKLEEEIENDKKISS